MFRPSLTRLVRPDAVHSESQRVVAFFLKEVEVSSDEFI